MATPLADFIVYVGIDGRVTTSASDVLAREIGAAADTGGQSAAAELDIPGQIDSGTNQKKEDGKLIIAEEIAKGHVSWPAFKLFIAGMGDRWTVMFWTVYMTVLLGADITDAVELWWLGWWARQYDNFPQSEVSIGYYLGGYFTLVLMALAFYVFGNVLYTFATIRASRGIHRSLVASILGCTFRRLDTTPASRIIARCTQDIQAALPKVDGPIADNLQSVLEITVSIVVKLGAVMVFTPIFVVPGAFVAIIGGYLGQVYMKAQMAVKREMSNAKSPVLAIFGGAIGGLTSIRAYGVQTAFKKETLARVDRYVRVSRMCYNLNRWITVRIDVLTALFTAGVAAYMVYGPVQESPSNVGFAVSMAAAFSEMILWWVRIFNKFEVSGNSLERIRDYLVIEQEPKPTDAGVPPAYWPTSGDIHVENLSARYSPDGPKVLHDVSFHLRSGERIGIVGRTGSGKSSLMLAMLRCIYTEGSVYFDGVPTHTVNLEVLRSSITIIPQLPELLSGTLRQNLDISGEHDDAALNEALRSAGFFALQGASSEQHHSTLDSNIAAGGANLSVGQRQIVALARALVRQSKLLILDEATSAIDYETDKIIQESLRSALAPDVTVITVAHCLPSVMSADRIMVLDAGHLVEFDSPRVLLKNDKSLLRALVDESVDKEVLYAMAAGL